MDIANHQKENLANNDRYVSEEEESAQNLFNRNIVESKELLQFRRDNVIYLVAIKGDLCDEGCRNIPWIDIIKLIKEIFGNDSIKIISEKDCEWDQWVEIAIFNYNTCIHEGTKHTPFEVVFGRLARSPSCEPLREDDLLPTYQGYIKDLVTRLTGIRTIVYNNLVEAKIRSKGHYDKKINSANFKVGDYVFLLKGPKPGKFGDHYTGPHEILEVINKKNVKIQFKGSSKTVHANRLRVSHINCEVKIKRKVKKHSEDE